MNARARLLTTALAAALTAGLTLSSAGPAAAFGCGDTCDDPVDYTSTLTVARPPTGAIVSDDGSIDCPAGGGGTCEVTDTVSSASGRPSYGWPRYTLSARLDGSGLSWTWDTPCHGADTCAVTNSAPSTSVSGHVADVAAPTITAVTIPDVVGSGTAIAAEATDNVAVTSYDWTVCDTDRCTTLPFHSHAINVGGPHPDGAVTITVTAYDAAGNHAQTTRTATFDGTAPGVQIYLPAPNERLDQSTSPVVFAAQDDHLVESRCAVDGGPAVACTSGWTATGLTLGSTHTISVTATDQAGNRFERDVVVDPAPDAISAFLLSNPSWDGGAFFITGLPSTATGEATIRDPATGTTVCTAHVATSGECDITPHVLEPGAHDLDVVYPGDGNVFAASGSISATVTRGYAEMSFAPVSGPYGTAHRVAVTGMPADATGTVTFATGGQTLCTGAVVRGTAACSTPATRAPGRYSVTASYSGDVHWQAPPVAAALTITKGGTQLRARAAARSVHRGRTVVLLAAGLPSAATGVVTFAVRGRPVCTIHVARGGASCTVTRTTAVGTYPVVVTYGGDADWHGSVSRFSFAVVR